MTTPVLTSKQLRKSLSAKKGTAKGLKNVLSTPFESYWPTLKKDHCAELEDLLRRLLPALKRPVMPKIPWSKLRMMSKQERSAARLEVQIKNNDENVDNSTKMESVVFGFNSVIRLLEKGNICSILLDSTVTPSIMVSLRQITFIAKEKNVPIFLVSYLKKVTLDTIGFASMAMGLKKNVANSPENFFYPLFKKILESPPEETVLKTVVSLFQDQSLMDGSFEDNKTDCESIAEQTTKVVKPFVLSSDVYLYRTSKSERVYKPSNESEENSLRETKDYIPLGDIDLDDISEQTAPMMLSDRKVLKTNKIKSNFTKETLNNKNKVTSEVSKSKTESKIVKSDYKPLKVKRLKGDLNRTKRTKPKGKK